MQAAMRLRKLGTTQGIMFFAPVEVHQSILDSRTKPREAFVDSADVVQWLLSSTATALEALVPLYWSNGANFVNRAQAAWENWNFLHDSTHTLEFVEKIREKEKTTLNKFYMPRFGSKISQDLKDYVTAPHLKAMLKELNKRRQAFQDTGIAVHASALEVNAPYQSETEATDKWIGGRTRSTTGSRNRDRTRDYPRASKPTPLPAIFLSRSTSGDRVFRQDWQTLAGARWLRERLCGVKTVGDWKEVRYQ
jgi:hypothetical protein